jgi:hypothetical protein
MALDWIALLRQHNIAFTMTGPNASRGHVNIKCPYCGDDPSEHLGISLGGYGWSCWRNAQHRGKSEAILVAKLLHCSPDEADRIVGGTVAVPADVALLDTLRASLGDQDEISQPIRTLSLLSEFKPLGNGSRFADQFLRYLTYERNYRASQLKWLLTTYNLHYAISGRFAYRIIIPFYDRWGELLTWTGRTIMVDEELRYKSLRREEQVCSPKETLLGLPLLWSCSNPRALLICEGPFDAFWVTAFGRSFGVYATCLSGLSLSSAQAELLLDLKERFSYQALLLDNSAQFQAFKIASAGLGLGTLEIPGGAKDPAVCAPADIINLCLNLRIH